MKQKHKKGWCESCRKNVIFVTHTDYKTNLRWVCTVQGCFHWVNKLEEKPKYRGGYV